MIALYIVISILAVIMLILIIPVDCVLDFSYNDAENRGVIILKYLFLKFKIFPTEEKVKKATKEIEEKETPKEKNDICGVIEFGKMVYHELKDDILKILNHLFKHTIRIKELNISSKFGVGDPMYTGIATGAVNAAVYNGVSFIDRNMQLDKWNVSLDSDFDNACLSAGVYCKIRTRALYVLILGGKIAWLILKIQRINRRMKENV